MAQATRAARISGAEETIPAWQAALVLILLLAVLAMAAVVARALLFTPRSYTPEELELARWQTAVRKDLSYLGEFGTRGIGYEVDQLILYVSRVLGLTTPRKVAIIGMGRLGPALLGYTGFAERGFDVVAVFDKSPDKIGTKQRGLTVQDVARLPEVAAAAGIDIAIIATPVRVAQAVADLLMESGVRAILNFAPVHLEVPQGVHLRQVDLSVELQILSFYLAREDEAT